MIMYCPFISCIGPKDNQLEWYDSTKAGLSGLKLYLNSTDEISNKVKTHFFTHQIN